MEDAPVEFASFKTLKSARSELLQLEHLLYKEGVNGVKYWTPFVIVKQSTQCVWNELWEEWEWDGKTY